MLMHAYAEKSSGRGSLFRGRESLQALVRVDKGVEILNKGQLFYRGLKHGAPEQDKRAQLHAERAILATC